MVEYKCPKCKARLAVAEAVSAGQQMMCPECDHVFAPGAPLPAKATPAAAAPPPVPLLPVDEESSPYGVIKESEEEQKLAAKNKPTFVVKDKGKRSARGPAMSLLVMPTNLLIGEGALTAVVGLLTTVAGAWPLLFAEAAPSEEEIVDQLFYVFCGIFAMAWGALICFGAAQMQNLGSYGWAITGAVIGCLPLLAGVFALATLRDPRVLEGFREPEGGLSGQEDIDEKKKDDDEDDDDEDDDDEEEDDRPRKKRKK